MPDSAPSAEAQPLLGQSNVTTLGGGGGSKKVLCILGIVAVSVAIVLLIALPLTLVERPVQVAVNGTNETTTTDLPATTTDLDTSLDQENGGTDVVTDPATDPATDGGVANTAVAGNLLEAAAVADDLLRIQADEVRVPPALPTEVFNVCDDEAFKCLWVTDTSTIATEADAAQRLIWIEVAATVNVTDEAHQVAADIVRRMVAGMSVDLFTALARNGKTGVQTGDEPPTIFPEYAEFRDTAECAGRCDAECAGTCFREGEKYDALSGIGKVRGVETEPNVLCTVDEDPYGGLDNGLVHEFSHTVHKYGIPYVNGGELWDQILSAYDNATLEGTWNLTSTAMSNYEEYWAKGTGVFFNANHDPVSAGGMNSCGLAEGEVCTCTPQGREWLAAQDPALFALLAEVYGNGDGDVRAGLNVCMTNPVGNQNCGPAAVAAK